MSNQTSALAENVTLYFIVGTEFVSELGDEITLFSEFNVSYDKGKMFLADDFFEEIGRALAKRFNSTVHIAGNGINTTFYYQLDYDHDK